MTKPAIRRGDYVRITGDHPRAGATGLVMEIMRADRNYDRRARVLVSDAYQPIVRLDLLEPVEEEA